MSTNTNEDGPPASYGGIGASNEPENSSPVLELGNLVTGSGVSEMAIPILTRDNHVRSLADIEADIIRFAIGHYGGQMSQAARKLGIGRSTLYRKLADLEIGHEE